MSFWPQRLLAALPLIIISSLASADAITGRVVDANGVGVAGVDIDFVSLGGGGNPHEANDGTDANGNFFTTVDPGVYEIRFFAPPPPASSLLTGVLPSVVVVGTKNVGTLTLDAGVAVSGTVKNTLGQPVGGVRVHVYNEETGAQVLAKGTTTSAFGTFALNVPANTSLRTELLTSHVVGQLLVPRRLLGSIPFSLDLGTLTLLPGFHVTGTVRDEAGAPVVGADVDVTVLPSNETLFTPGDNTNTLGNFDVVVPAGSFALAVGRPASQVLVGVEFDNLIVNAPTPLGVMTMRPGVFLSGTVIDRDGLPVLAADVNVFEVATGASLALGSDNTNAAGFYSVVVPLGLMDVLFSAPGSHLENWHYGISVTGNTTLDGQFLGPPRGVLGTPPPTPHSPKTPSVIAFANGTSGTAGVPFIEGRLGDGELVVRLFGGRPDAQARLLLGVERGPLGLLPGVDVVRPVSVIPVELDFEGRARVRLPLQESNPRAQTALAQFVVLDPEAEAGLALSHTLEIPTD